MNLTQPLCISREIEVAILGQHRFLFRTQTVSMAVGEDLADDLSFQIESDHGNPVSARIAEDSTEKAPVITPYFKIARVAEEILLADRVVIDVGIKGRLTCSGKHLHANGQIRILLVQGLDDPELEQVIGH